MINKEYSFDNYKNEDYIECYSVQDVYKNMGDNTFELAKEDVKCKQKIWKHEISYVKEVANTKGNIRRQRIELGFKYKDPIVVMGRYKDIHPIIFPTSNKHRIVGFKFY